MSAFSTLTYAKKYFVSDEIEFVTERDLEFDIQYKIPEDLLNLRVDNLIVDEKIGIGTTQPQQRLDVAGSVKIDENIYDSVNAPGRNGYQLSHQNMLFLDTLLQDQQMKDRLVDGEVHISETALTL